MRDQVHGVPPPGTMNFGGCEAEWMREGE
jgi:hypothetical protein